jgi:hypothetical protein
MFHVASKTEIEPPNATDSNRKSRTREHESAANLRGVIMINKEA